jgi:hypothetical protein
MSVDDVKHCARIGILQLRQNKGKTFVVDVPLATYEDTSQIDNEVAELLGHSAKVQKQIPKKIFPKPKAKASSVKTVSGKVKNNIQNAVGGLKKNTESVQKTTSPAAAVESDDESDLPRVPERKSNIASGDIKQLVEQMLKKAQQAKNNAGKINPELSVKENKQDALKVSALPQITKQASAPKPAPTSNADQNKPYIDMIVNIINKQLDDVEKKIKK